MDNTGQATALNHDESSQQLLQEAENVSDILPYTIVETCNKRRQPDILNLAGFSIEQAIWTISGGCEACARKITTDPKATTGLGCGTRASGPS